MDQLSQWAKFLPIIFVMVIGVLTPFVMVGVGLYFVQRRKVNTEHGLQQLADELDAPLHSSPLNALPIAKDVSRSVDDTAVCPTS